MSVIKKFKYYNIIMEQKKIRKYNSLFRKKLIIKLEKIKDKSDLISIYNIIINDIGTNFSSNRNGFFININLLSNNCIEELETFINSKININKIENTSKMCYTVYTYDNIDKIINDGNKLSNQEKLIINRIKN